MQDLDRPSFVHVMKDTVISTTAKRLLSLVCFFFRTWSLCRAHYIASSKAGGVAPNSIVERSVHGQDGVRPMQSKRNREGKLGGEESKVRHLLFTTPADDSVRNSPSLLGRLELVGCDVCLVEFVRTLVVVECLPALRSQGVLRSSPISRLSLSPNTVQHAY